jgi:DNA-binding transcriptional MerR regulator
MPGQEARGVFRIGDFSRLTQVTVKALRHYDRLGLLKPDHIDPESGYRYYTSAQAPRLNRIVALKELGFSLEQIGQLLDADLSAEQLRGMLMQKQQEIHGAIVAEQTRLERIAERLRQIEQGSPSAQYDVTVKRVPAQRVAAIRALLPDYPAIAPLFDELRAYQRRHGLTATQWTAVWLDGEYRETDIGVQASFTTDDPLPEHPRIREDTLPAVETMACVLHHGPMMTVGAAHLAIFRWMEANAYRVAGPTRTIPIHDVGPHSAEGIVEIQYPVERGNPDTAHCPHL